MSARTTQSKALNAKHADILKAMLKEPANRTCADCKKNDARWASTNLGVFFCIRCSGIHRGMGVHISRVKSVDLDTWTPEQIANIQRWGNKRANRYWEYHLREGHQPPDHKMESFIRSKYEVKKWVKEGGIPEPETLDDPSEAVATGPPAAAAAAVSPPKPKPSSSSFDLLDGPPSAGRSVVSPASVTPASATSGSAAPNTSSSNGLFDLNFGSPSSSAAAQAAPASPPPQKKDPKADILSLFSSIPAAQPAAPQNQLYANPSAGFGGVPAAAANPWGQPQPQQQAQFQQGFGAQQPQPPSQQNAFGGFQGWGAPAPAQSQPPAYQQQSQMFQQPQNNAFGGFSAAPTAVAGGGGGVDLFNSSSVWGTPAGGAAPAAGSNQGASQQKDAFGDIWGDFK